MATPFKFASRMCSSAVTTIHNVFQINPPMLPLSGGESAGFIHEGRLGPLSLIIDPGTPCLGHGVLCPEFVAWSLNFVIWYCFLMSRGNSAPRPIRVSPSFLKQSSWQDGSPQRLQEPSQVCHLGRRSLQIISWSFQASHSQASFLDAAFLSEPLAGVKEGEIIHITSKCQFLL